MKTKPSIQFTENGIKTFAAIDNAEFVLRSLPQWSNWRYEESELARKPILIYEDEDVGTELPPRWKIYRDAKELCGDQAGLAYIVQPADWETFKVELLWLANLPGVRLFDGTRAQALAPPPVHDIPALLPYILTRMSGTPHALRLSLERFEPQIEQFMHTDAIPELWHYIYGDAEARLFGMVIEEYLNRRRFSSRNVRELREHIRRYGYSQLEDIETMYKSARSYQESPPEKPRPQHPDLLMEAGVTVLAGRPKQGKSFMALDLALSIAMSEHLFLGVYPMQVPGEVLYYALEDHAPRMYQRLRGLLPIETFPSNLYFGYEAPRVSEGFLDLLSVWMRHKPATKLIVIDILKHVQSRRERGENLYDFEYDDMKQLIEFAHAHRLHILMVTHLRKLQSRDGITSDDVMSSTAITGGASNVWLLQRRKDEDVDATLAISGKDVPSWEMALKWRMGLHQPFWEAIGDNHQLVLGATMRSKILRVLLHWEDEGPTQHELLEQINPTFSKGTFHRLIKSLLDKHLIRKSEHRLSLTEAGAEEASREE